MTYETPFRMIKRKKEANEKITHFICTKRFRRFSPRMFIKETQGNHTGSLQLDASSQKMQEVIDLKEEYGVSGRAETAK